MSAEAKTQEVFGRTPVDGAKIHAYFLAKDIQERFPDLTKIGTYPRMLLTVPILGAGVVATDTLFRIIYGQQNIAWAQDSCSGELRVVVQDFKEGNGQIGFQPGTSDKPGRLIPGIKVDATVPGKQVQAVTTNNDGIVEFPVSGNCVNDKDGVAGVPVDFVVYYEDRVGTDKTLKGNTVVKNGQGKQQHAYLPEGAKAVTPVSPISPVFPRANGNGVDDWWKYLLVGAGSALLGGLIGYGLSRRGRDNLVVERNQAQADAAGFAQGMDQALDERDMARNERNQAEDERDEARLGWVAANAALATRTAELLTRTNERDDARADLADTVLETRELLNGCEQHVDHLEVDLAELEDDLNDAQADLAAVTVTREDLRTRFNNAVTAIRTELGRHRPLRPRISEIRTTIDGIGPI